MRKIFELTKREQRIVILIVTVLVAVAFAKHFWQSALPHAPMTGRQSPAPDSPDQLADKSGKRP